MYNPDKGRRWHHAKRAALLGLVLGAAAGLTICPNLAKASDRTAKIVGGDLVYVLKDTYSSGGYVDVYHINRSQYELEASIPLPPGCSVSGKLDGDPVAKANHLAVSAERSEAYVLCTDTSTPIGIGYVFVIDTTKNAVISTIQLPRRNAYGGLALAPGGARLYVELGFCTNFGKWTKGPLPCDQDGVQAIDLTTRQLSAFVRTALSSTANISDTSTTLHQMLVSPSGDRLYLSFSTSYDSGRTSVLVIDTTHNVVVTAIQHLDEYGAGSIAIVPDSSRLYMASNYCVAPAITTLDLGANATAGTFGLPPNTSCTANVALAFAGSKLYATASSYFNEMLAGIVYVYDTKDSSPHFRTLFTSPEPPSDYYSPDLNASGSTLYLAEVRQPMFAGERTRYFLVGLGTKESVLAMRQFIYIGDGDTLRNGITDVVVRKPNRLRHAALCAHNLISCLNQH